jgi:hypothetical protein
LSRRGSGMPIVQRRYEIHEQTCVSALKLLLRDAARRGNDGGGDGKEIDEHVPARESIRGGQHRHHGR